MNDARQARVPGARRRRIATGPDDGHDHAQSAHLGAQRLVGGAAGRAVRAVDARFILTPLSAGRTRLDIEAHFRVTSSFNGYAVAVSEFLGRDFVDGLLALYKRRAEIPA